MWRGGANHFWTSYSRARQRSQTRSRMNRVKPQSASHRGVTQHITMVFAFGCFFVATMSFTISSPSFSHHGSIPPIHTRCDGDEISPPLQWSGVPERTKSLALIVDDPDAPDPAAPKMTWVHWVLYNIPPTASGLTQGVSALPEGTKEAKNDWKVTGYGGPSPPKGTHRYFHKLYALDTLLPNLGTSATKNSVEEAMKGHILGQAELVGTYKKQK